MDIYGALLAALAYFQANWTVIEGLARNLAADLVTIYTLGLGLAAVLKKFFPTTGSKLQIKLLSVFKQ